MEHKETNICYNCGHPVIFYVSGFHGKWQHFDGSLINIWAADGCRNAGNYCNVNCYKPEVISNEHRIK